MKTEYLIRRACVNAGLYLKAVQEKNFTQQMYQQGYIHGIEAASDFDHTVSYVVTWAVFYSLHMASIEPDLYLHKSEVRDAEGR